MFQILLAELVYNGCKKQTFFSHISKPVTKGPFGKIRAYPGFVCLLDILRLALYVIGGMDRQGPVSVLHSFTFALSHMPPPKKVFVPQF